MSYPTIGMCTPEHSSIYHAIECSAKSRHISVAPNNMLSGVQCRRFGTVFPCTSTPYAYDARRVQYDWYITPLLRPAVSGTTGSTTFFRGMQKIQTNPREHATCNVFHMRHTNSTSQYISQRRHSEALCTLYDVHHRK